MGERTFLQTVKSQILIRMSDVAHTTFLSPNGYQPIPGVVIVRQNDRYRIFFDTDLWKASDKVSVSTLAPGKVSFIAVQHGGDGKQLIPFCLSELEPVEGAGEPWPDHVEGFYDMWAKGFW
ncbi:hypothetical protein HOI18_00035 [Candidatus Uhrbacteria bacterium]|jgi:hypothetical protein|nr:hypothetical protein [Candidatus Uhrbacteria bacterium]